MGNFVKKGCIFVIFCSNIAVIIGLGGQKRSLALAFELYKESQYVRY
jgi:hypothetical protein